MIKRQEGISPNLTKARINLLLLVKLFNWLNHFDHGLLTDACLSAQTDYIMTHRGKSYFLHCCVTGLNCQKRIIILHFHSEQSACSAAPSAAAQLTTTTILISPAWDFNLTVLLNHPNCPILRCVRGTTHKDNHSAGDDGVRH